MIAGINLRTSLGHPALSSNLIIVADEQCHHLKWSLRSSNLQLYSEPVLSIRSTRLTSNLVQSSAFLQGVTYEELAKLTGEPLREASFYLPPGSVPLLKRVPGFETFDPFQEVLHNDKPGTGLVDAPRAFSLKLSMILTALNLKATSIDAELCVLHDSNSKLVLMVTKHVDDLKIAAERKVAEWLIGKLQETFGELKISWHDFLNCGVQHTQTPTTFEVELHQIAYLANLKVIAHSDLCSTPNDDLATPELVELFISLVGALAYTLLTRVDISVFVACLQRMSHKLRIIHVKRLNAVLRYCQRFPKRLVYKQLPKGVVHLRCVCDAAFLKEQDSGHALRGAIYILCVKTDTGSSGSRSADGDPSSPQVYMQGSCIHHIVDYVCRSEKHVTRSTFAAELFSACDAAGHGIFLALGMHEVLCGVSSKEYNRKLREQGGFACPINIVVDAMNVYSSTTATFVKPPTEKSMLTHVQYLRELLGTKVLASFVLV